MNADPYASPATVADPTFARQDAAVAAGVLRQLAGTKPWVRFISVMILIGAGLMLLGGFFMMFAGAMMTKGTSGNGMSFLGPVMGVVYLAFAALYVYPGVKLWKYATHIGSLLERPSVANLETALNEQRSFWKFVGVLMLAVIVLYLLIGIVAVIGAVAAAASGS